MAENWKMKIRPLLSGIEKYNPSNIVQLENYVKHQATSDDYDFDANLVLMKLYQFHPTKASSNVACQILLKALTNLPTTDVIMLKAVLPTSLLKDVDIQHILTLHTLLESCQFREFWATLKRENMEVTKKIDNLESSIRRYICGVVEISYQNIPLSILKQYLGELEGPTLNELAAAHKWEVTGDMCFIRNQEELIKPKKILAKIELDSVSGILATIAAR